MKKSLRFVVLACTGFVGLAFAAPALATYSPSLTIEQTSYRLGAAITADVFVFAPQNDDPTAKITISSPPGYGVNITQAPGTKIGRVVAFVKAKALANSILPLTGDVLVGNPTDPTIVAQSQQCTGSPTNQAVWILNASLQGQALPIPVFVNKVGPLATMQVCFRSPDVPTSSGGAPFGAQLVAADFTLGGVFTNASSSKGYEWSGIFTPYTPGTAIPNLPATLEWRTFVGLPSSLTFKRVKSSAGLKFAGALHITGVSSRNIRLRLYYGRKANPAPNAVRGSDPKAKVARTAPLPSSGKYSLKRPGVKVRTFFQMRFENYVTDSCAPPSPAPQGCKGEDLAALTSSQVRVLPPKKRR